MLLRSRTTVLTLLALIVIFVLANKTACNAAHSLSSAIGTKWGVDLALTMLVLLFFLLGGKYDR